MNDIREIAKMLDGREYGSEVTKEEAAAFKKEGIVVVYGASDDLTELKGAICDEYGAGDTIYFNELGRIIQNECCDGCLYFEKIIQTAPWYLRSSCELPWEWSTNIPHAVFTVVEDGEEYGKGIVFSKHDLVK